MKIVFYPQLTPISSLVRTLALTFPCCCITIYIDNYFTSVPLLKEPRSCEFSAAGTTRLHLEFPLKIKKLKDQFLKRLKWNTLLVKVVQNTLCLAWQDNNIVLVLINIHTVNTAKDQINRIRKRPVKALTNSALIQKVFKDLAKKELRIPTFINNYNHFIGGQTLQISFERRTSCTEQPFIYGGPYFIGLLM